MRFVGGFERAGFAYFIAVRRESETSEMFRTFILRFCVNDTRLHSLVELRLDCESYGFPFYVARDVAVAQNFVGGGVGGSGKVLYGLFEDPEGRKNSAVCVYSLEGVEAAFFRAVSQCFKGDGSKGPEWVAKVSPLYEFPG